jgi:hypothetical protein
MRDRTRIVGSQGEVEEVDAGLRNQTILMWFPKGGEIGSRNGEEVRGIA